MKNKILKRITEEGSVNFSTLIREFNLAGSELSKILQELRTSGKIDYCNGTRKYTRANKVSEATQSYKRVEDWDPFIEPLFPPPAREGALDYRKYPSLIGNVRVYKEYI